jgi:hypothetical protein
MIKLRSTTLQIHPNRHQSFFRLRKKLKPVTKIEGVQRGDSPELG